MRTSTGPGQALLVLASEVSLHVLNLASLSLRERSALGLEELPATHKSACRCLTAPVGARLRPAQYSGISCN